jgi:general secretion pathway protein I
LSRITAHSGGTDGFTLVEVLVALTILAVLLSAIGALVATSVRGVRTIERHLMEIEIARGIATALPDRDQLVPGNLHGNVAGHRWRLDVLPFIASFSAPPSTPWVPQRVIMTVHSPSGGALQIETVRLQQRSAR